MVEAAWKMSLNCRRHSPSYIVISRLLHQMEARVTVQPRCIVRSFPFYGQHCDGKMSIWQRTGLLFLIASFAVLLLAMVTFGENGPMNDIGQVPTSDSQDEVERRRFRRRWLRIGNLACEARHVAVSGIPLIQSECGEGFDRFEILWVQRASIPESIDVSNTRHISPLDFIHEFPRGVPASMPQLNQQWEDILDCAWRDGLT